MIAKRWMQINNQIFTVWIFIVHIWPHQLSSYPQSFHVCWQYYAYTQEYNRSLERHGLGVSTLVSWFRVKCHSGQEQRRTAVFAGYITNAMMQIWNRRAFRPEGIEIQNYVYLVLYNLVPKSGIRKRETLETISSAVMLQKQGYIQAKWHILGWCRIYHPTGTSAEGRETVMKT